MLCVWVSDCVMLCVWMIVSCFVYEGWLCYALFITCCPTYCTLKRKRKEEVQGWLDSFFMIFILFIFFQFPKDASQYDPSKPPDSEYVLVEPTCPSWSVSCRTIEHVSPPPPPPPPPGLSLSHTNTHAHNLIPLLCYLYMGPTAILKVYCLHQGPETYTNTAVLFGELFLFFSAVRIAVIDWWDEPLAVAVFFFVLTLRRRTGQSVTASDFRSNGPRFESGRGRCVESLDKALYSHCPKEKPSH